MKQQDAVTVWILMWFRSIYLYNHSLQMALQQSSLVRRGSLSSLCRWGFSHKSEIQQPVVKLCELPLVVPISRNSRQEQFFIYCFITDLF